MKKVVAKVLAYIILFVFLAAVYFVVFSIHNMVKLPSSLVVKGQYLYVAEENVIHKYTLDGKRIAKWGKKGDGLGQFDVIMDIAVDDDGNVYVAERANKRVQKIDRDGKWVASWYFFSDPVALLAANGSVYVVDTGLGRIFHLSTNGEVIHQ
ncbi:MAG: hypothetical protein Q8N68_02265, partial [bacterium]|nr:hypothetical protein [bacterium]